jgi:hypothetical protein
MSFFLYWWWVKAYLVEDTKYKGRVHIGKPIVAYLVKKSSIDVTESSKTLAWVLRRLHFSFWELSQNCEKWLLSSSRLSVHPFAWNNLASTGRIFMKYVIWRFFENLSRKFKLH